MMWSRLLLVTFLAAVMPSNAQDVEYGVDCSFPIHSKEFRCGDILGDRKKVYEDFMQGCRDFYGKKGKRCDQTEEDRIVMSARQPQSMVNYTDTGFKKIKAPPALFKLLKEFWEDNKDKMKQETWPVGNIYTNHWKAPTYMVSVEDTTLKGIDHQFTLKNKIWDAAKTAIQEWTGNEIKPTSLYGVRVYTEGAILSPHVDRLPLVSSCIVNVAQDIDEDWPLEVIDRYGNSVNVTMEPGDMVLYESGSLIHGRTFALKGRFYANIFIHFEPTGRKLGDTTDDYLNELDDFYPPYLLPNSPELETWKMQNPYGWKKPSPSAAHVDTPTIHYAALNGDIDLIAEIYSKDSEAIHSVDRNGWQPIHEAARAGHLETVKMLIDLGADKNARTYFGVGESVLNVAINSNTDKHKVSRYLKDIGAKNILPDEL